MFQGEWLVYNNRQTFDLAIRADGDRASSTVKANEFNTDHDVTFTIWAIDDQGNEGKRSNEIVIKSQPGSLHPLDAWAWALIGVGGVVLLALSVVILICCLCPAKCSKAERKQEEVQDWIKGKSEGLKSFNSKMVKETPPSLVPTEDCGIPTFYDEDYVVGNQAFRTEPPHFNEPTFFGQADLDRMRNPDGDFSNGSHNRSKAVGSFERWWRQLFSSNVLLTKVRFGFEKSGKSTWWSSGPTLWALSREQLWLETTAILVRIGRILIFCFICKF